MPANLFHRIIAAALVLFTSMCIGQECGFQCWSASSNAMKEFSKRAEEKFRQGDLSTSDSLTMEAFRISAKNFGWKDPQTVVLADRLAGLRAMSGRYEGAVAMRQLIWDSLPRDVPQDRIRMAGALVRDVGMLGDGRRLRAAQALQIEACEGGRIEDHPECAQVMSRYAAGNVDGASMPTLGLWRRADDWCRRSACAWQPARAEVLSGLAVAELSAGDLAGAERDYRALLAFCDKGGDSLLMPRLLALGGIAGVTSDRKEAVRMERDALSISRKMYGASSSQVVARSCRLAERIVRGGDSQELHEAQALVDTSLRQAERLPPGSGNALVRSCLRARAQVHRASGRSQEEREDLRQLVAMRGDSLGSPEEGGELADDVSSLASAEFMSGSLTESVMHYEEAIRSRMQPGFPKGEALAQDLGQLGLVRIRLGEYGEALSAFDQAEPLLLGDANTSKVSIVQLYQSKSLCLQSLGRPKDADSVLDLAMRWLPAKDTVLLASLHMMRSLIYRDMHRKDEADSLWKLSSRLDKGRDGSLYRIFDEALSGVDGAGPKASISMERRKEILRTAEKEGGANSMMAAAAWKLLASGHAAKGRNDSASRAYARALRIAVEVGDEGGTSDLYEKLMDFHEEEVSGLSSFWGKLLVDSRQRSKRSLEDSSFRESYLQTVRAGYLHCIAGLLRSQRVKEAQAVAGLLKRSDLISFTAGGVSAGEVPLDSMERAWRDSLDRNRHILDAARASVEKLGAGAGEQEALDRSRAGFDSMLVRMERAFTGSEPSPGERARRDSAASSAYQEMLARQAPGTVLLQYVLLDSTGFVLVTSRSGVACRPLGIGKVRLRKDVERYLQVLGRPSEDPRPFGKKLHASLFEPVSGLLDSLQAATLLLSLDGSLRYLPMASLHDGKRFLVERYAMDVFTEASGDVLAESPRAAWSVAGLGSSRGGAGFDSLPAVRQELRGIVRTDSSRDGVLPGSIRVDSAFTKEGLLRALSEKRSVVHLASHFRFSPSGERDSYLLLGDGSRLDLHELRTGPYSFQGIDLLTLSACRTAVTGSRDANGIEIDGMAGVAQSRGAKAVMATLWPVYDASTQSFMQEFYRDRETGLSKAAALRKAQLAFLEGKAGKKLGKPNADGLFVPPKGAPYAHPYYWAPFILMGNWL